MPIFFALMVAAGLCTAHAALFHRGDAQIAVGGVIVSAFFGALWALTGVLFSWSG